MSKRDEIDRLLGEPVRNLMHSFYDNFVEANVRYKQKTGVKSLIIRRQVGKCCDWCAALAGIYEYGNHPDEVFARHDACKCMVTFKSEKGGYTDVWSKKEYSNQREARIARSKEERTQVPFKNRVEEISYKKKDIPEKKVVNMPLQEYTEKEIDEMAQTTEVILKRHTDKESKWSGKISIKDGAYGKEWDCSISTGLDTSPHIIMHEQLHARSISHYGKEAYEEYEGVEEATIQYFNQEISKKEGIKIIESAYDDNVNILRQLRRILEPETSDYGFAKTLFELDVADRMDYLEELLRKYALANDLPANEAGDISKLIERAFEVTWR